MLARPPLFSTTLVVALLATRAAAAEPSHADQVAADALFTSAKQAMDRGDYATACPKLVESQRLDPAPGTLLNLAECDAHLGHLRAALAAFEQARGQLAAGDFRIGFAESRIAALRARIARLTVRFEPLPAGAAAPPIVCDGADARAGMPLAMDPGMHVCTSRVEGQPDIRAEVTLHDGEERTIVLRAPSSVATHAAASTAISPDGSPPSPDAGRAQRTWGVVVGGLGAAGLAFGGVMALVAKGTYDGAAMRCAGGPTACPPSAIDDGATAHHQAAIATWAIAGGAALLATGVALYVTAPRSAVVVAPRAGSGYGGLELKGSF